MHMPCGLKVLAKHYPGLKVHDDIRTLDLASEVPKGVLINVIVISTPCVDVSSRGAGMAQLGEESCLFFTAVNKVKQYAHLSGHLPTILSENVQGRRFRRLDTRDKRKVRSFGSSLLHERAYRHRA
jgi:site-specific DNA-cytosine methylase